MANVPYEIWEFAYLHDESGLEESAESMGPAWTPCSRGMSMSAGRDSVRVPHFEGYAGSGFNYVKVAELDTKIGMVYFYKHGVKKASQRPIIMRKAGIVTIKLELVRVFGDRAQIKASYAFTDAEIVKVLVCIGASIATLKHAVVQEMNNQHLGTRQTQLSVRLPENLTHLQRVRTVFGIMPPAPAQKGGVMKNNIKQK